jgi:hypothetical protein
MTNPIKLVFAMFLVTTILLAVVSYKSGVNDGMDESERQFKKVLKKMTVVENKCVNVPSYDCYRIKDFN